MRCGVMKSKKKKVIGIYGGLGPAATDDLNIHITKLVPVTKDQDHPRRVVIYAPDTPDRTRALLHGDEDPLPIMKEVVKELEKAGATVIGIPCNTAHAFLPKIQKSTRVPIVNMIEVAVLAIKKNHKKVKKVGILATTGTIKTKIYSDMLTTHGFDPVVPDDSNQEIVMDGIYGKDGVKQTSQWTKTANQKFKKVANHLIKQGAQVIIMGCTEIPLALSDGDVKTLLVNPTKELAKTLITYVA